MATSAYVVILCAAKTAPTCRTHLQHAQMLRPSHLAIMPWLLSVAQVFTPG